MICFNCEYVLKRINIIVSGVIKRKKGCLLSKQKLHEKKVDILDQLQELELQKLRESIAQQKAEHEQRMRHNEEKHKLEMEKLNLL